MTNWDDPESRLALMLRAFSMDILDDDLRETHRLYVDIDRVIGGSSMEQIFLDGHHADRKHQQCLVAGGGPQLEELCEYARQGLDGMWNAARKPIQKPTHQGGSG